MKWKFRFIAGAEAIANVSNQGIAKLKQINADAIGWIVFNDSYVNNPLVQANGNSYYAKLIEISSN